MEKLKFLNECSTESIKEVFDPEYKKQLNCSLAEHVLRLLAIELMEREGLDWINNPEIREAIVNDHATCKHGYSAAFCKYCDMTDEEIMEMENDK